MGMGLEVRYAHRRNGFALMQSSHAGTIVPVTRDIVRTDGVLGLCRGTAATLLRCADLRMNPTVSSNTRIHVQQRPRRRHVSCWDEPSLHYACKDTLLLRHRARAQQLRVRTSQAHETRPGTYLRFSRLRPQLSDGAPRSS